MRGSRIVQKKHQPDRERRSDAGRNRAERPLAKAGQELDRQNPESEADMQRQRDHESELRGLDPRVPRRREKAFERIRAPERRAERQEMRRQEQRQRESRKPQQERG